MTTPDDEEQAVDSLEATAAAANAERAARRLRALAAVLLAVAVPGLFWLADHPRDYPTWLVVGVALVMLLAELFPVDLELRHESHSFSFTKVPIVVGVYLLSPVAAIAARLVSSVIVLAGVQRQPPLKLIINLIAHLLEVMVAASVVIVLRPAGPFGPGAWAVVALAVTAADVVAAFVISSAISVFQGRWERGLVAGVVAGLVAGVPDVALAIIMVTMLEAGNAAAWIVLVSGAAFVALSRAYSNVAARNQAMQLLDRFSRAISGAVLDGTATRALLSETSEILHSDAAWLIVPDSNRTRRIALISGAATEFDATELDMAIAAEAKAAAGALLHTEDGPLGSALRSEGHTEVVFCAVSDDPSNTAILVAADRSGTVRPFDRQDVALFETLASHAGLALLNVGLLDRLRDEVSTTEHQATHDALTGLPNRTLFQSELESAIADGDRPAVLLIDLDRFKDVNDTLGHHNGDRLLREIAHRLESSLAAAQCVARLGGDEFAVLLTGSPAPELATRQAADLAARLELPVTVAGVEVDVGASIGVAIATDESTDPDTLLRQADVAMYTAKADRSVVESYSADRDNYSPQRLSMVGRLRTAIENGDLVMHYQPQIELATGRVIGVEALVRWPQPGRDPVRPDEFIYIAEHTGLIRPLTRLVMDLTITQAARWHRQHRDLRVSFNLSPHNLIEPGIVEAIRNTLDRSAVRPDRVMIEVTESSVMANPKRTLGVLHDLRELGVGIAIDDFGTGHSSLAYLTTLPATELKIDRSFVLALGVDPSANSIVQSIVDLGRNLDLDVIAEGVETEHIAHTLTTMGCRLAQGYLYSRPLDTRTFERWHAQHDAGRAPLQLATEPDPRSSSHGSARGPDLESRVSGAGPS